VVMPRFGQGTEMTHALGRPKLSGAFEAALSLLAR
jgi:hypothetical protein